MKKIDFRTNINDNELIEAANAIKNGELVIFPTETVYGIGANALDEKAVNKIFEAKGRANDNPLIVHISDFDMIYDIAYSPNEIEQKLIDAFMPGPFTIVLRKKGIIPTNVSAGLDTVGIRMPDNLIAKSLIEKANVPIAAPSANISSRPSGTNINDIEEEFNNKVTFIIDGGDTKIGIESTVCKVIDSIPTILRPGKITDQDILNIIGKVKIDNHVFNNIQGIVESPGMKYKHYAPLAQSFLVYSDDDTKQINLINNQIIDNTAVIGFNEHKDYIKSKYFICVGSINDLDSMAHNIFTKLREADKLNPSQIIIEGVKKEGLGIAIMNRLIRACNYNYIEE